VLKLPSFIAALTLSAIVLALPGLGSAAPADLDAQAVVQAGSRSPVNPKVFQTSGTIKPGEAQSFYVQCTGYTLATLSPLGSYGSLNITIYNSANQKVSWNHSGSTVGTGTAWYGNDTFRIEVTTPGNVPVQFGLTLY
jgi:hypothetical protein